MQGFDRLLAALDVSVKSLAVDRIGESATLDASLDPTVLYVLCGDGRLCAPGRPAVMIEAETFVLVPGGLSCRVESRSTLVAARGAVVASFGGGAGPFDRINAPIVVSFAAHPMRQSFEMLVEETASPHFGARALADCIVKQAIVLLLRAEFGADRSEPLPWIPALRDDRLGRAVAAMLDRPSDPLTLETLARIAGMSRSSFSGRFNAAFGRSPIDFLKGVRLARAARMLATTDLPVKHIASAVGYESRSYFSRAFRSRYDSDPSDYRISCAEAA